MSLQPGVYDVKCPRCSDTLDPSRTFCPGCGKLADKEVLNSIQLAGLIGVRNSTSPAIERFWATGDVDTPGL